MCQVAVIMIPLHAFSIVSIGKVGCAVEIDPFVACAGLAVGFIVGLTGMGGGALMTPVLVLVFGVQPLAAVSSDLVASAVMKPVGAGVHLRRGTVNRRLAACLVLGSVPAAFCGVLVLRTLGDGEAVQDRIKTVMGAVLVVAAASMVAKSVIDRRRDAVVDDAEIRVRPLATMVVGCIGGLAVGMTSVGSGSLIIVMLLALHPRMRASQLVGTDLVQAVPLVASASLGHLLFGDFQLGLTGSLLVGSLPGVYLGARVSAGESTSRAIRPVLVLVIALSGLKLVGVPTGWLGAVLAAGVLAMAVGAMARRRRAASVPPLQVGAPALPTSSPRPARSWPPHPPRPLASPVAGFPVDSARHGGNSPT